MLSELGPNLFWRRSVCLFGRTLASVVEVAFHWILDCVEAHHLGRNASKLLYQTVLVRAKHRCLPCPEL